VPVEKIQNMRRNLFSIEPPHEYRQRYLTAWYEYMLVVRSGLELTYKAMTVPSTSTDDSRIFPIYAFQKTQNEPRFNFVYNPTGASFAQAT